MNLDDRQSSHCLLSFSLLGRIECRKRAGRSRSWSVIQSVHCPAVYLCLVSLVKSITCRVGWWLGVSCTHGFKGWIRGTCQGAQDHYFRQEVSTWPSSRGSPSLRGPTTPLCGTSFTPRGLDKTDWGKRT